VGALAAPNFLVAVGYTSVADQFALDAFNVMSNGWRKKPTSLRSWFFFARIKVFNEKYSPTFAPLLCIKFQ